MEEETKGLFVGWREWRQEKEYTYLLHEAESFLKS